MSLILALALAHADPGAHLAVVDNNQTVTFACAPGGSVDIAGNRNAVTLTGDCAAINVLGNDNTVNTEATSTLSVLGNNNTVLWGRGVGKAAPTVSNLGNGNRVSKKR